MARSGTRGPRGRSVSRSIQAGRQWIRPGCGTSLAFRDVWTGAGSRAATNLTGCAITRPAPRRRAAPGGGWTPASKGEGRPGHGPREHARGPMTGTHRYAAASVSTPRSRRVVAASSARTRPTRAAAAGPGRPAAPARRPTRGAVTEQRPGRDRLGERGRPRRPGRAGGERVRDAERPGEERRRPTHPTARAAARRTCTPDRPGPSPMSRPPGRGRARRHRVLHPLQPPTLSERPAADRSCRGRRSAGR